MLAVDVPDTAAAVDIDDIVNTVDIVDLVPHRAPMLLLDRVVSIDGLTLCAEVTFHRDCMFFDPSTGQVGAWIGIEYMAQAIAALEGSLSLQRGLPVQVGFLLGTRQFETRCAGFVEGTRLLVHARQTLLHDNGLAAFECRINDAADMAANSAAAPLVQATVTVFKPNDALQFLSTSQC